MSQAARRMPVCKTACMVCWTGMFDCLILATTAGRCQRLFHLLSARKTTMLHRGTQIPLSGTIILQPAGCRALLVTTLLPTGPRSLLQHVLAYRFLRRTLTNQNVSVSSLRDAHWLRGICALAYGYTVGNSGLVEFCQPQPRSKAPVFC